MIKKLKKIYAYLIAIFYYLAMMISMYKARYFHKLSINFLDFSLKYEIKGKLIDALIYASRNFNADEKNKLNKLSLTQKQLKSLSYEIVKDDKRKFIQSKIKKLDLSLFEGKSIAIVGNSPIEKWKNKGKEIDNHDYVLRLNNYVIKDEFISDYGSKCNIWGLIGNDDVNKRENLSSYDFIILRDDVYLRGFSDKVIDSLCEYAKQKDIYYIGRDADIEFCKKYNLFNLSTGLGFILALRNCNMKFYGFGFDEKQYDEKDRHYFVKYKTKRNIRKYHIWEVENQILNDLRREK